MKNDDRKSTTIDARIPVASDEHSLTVGRDGPILPQDHYFIEQMANFKGEKIPERQPHAKGCRGLRNMDKEIGDRITKGVKSK
jgi:catalase